MRDRMLRKVERESAGKSREEETGRMREGRGGRPATERERAGGILEEERTGGADRE